MNANRPSMSDRAGVALAAAAIVVTFAGASAITHLRNPSDPGRHARAAIAGRGVEVTTTLYTTQSGQAIYVIADVSIVNNADKAVAYIGMACSDPVTVEFRSTTPDPAGPPYRSSAAALRARIMQYRRTLDGPLEFADEAPPNATGKMAGCDESAPPILPPHQRFAYRQRAELVLGGTVWGRRADHRRRGDAGAGRCACIDRAATADRSDRHDRGEDPLASGCLVHESIARRAGCHLAAVR
jgi:hypothetical protein